MPPGFVTTGVGLLVSDWVVAEEDVVELSTGGNGSLVVWALMDNNNNNNVIIEPKEYNRFFIILTWNELIWI